jgi:hypothetical protein
VKVDAPAMGIGSRLRIYRAGTQELIGCQDLAAGYGYASSQTAIAHFGLGREESCDLEVTLPHGKGKTLRKGVKADQRVTLKP